MKRIAVTDKRRIGQVIPKPYLKERDPAFIKSIARARKQVREGQVKSIEEIKRRYGLK